MNSSAIVNKVWSFCNVLRDDGVGYGDYLEQLTYLLFLKMADEYSKPPYNRKIGIPDEFTWETLTSRKGADLEDHYAKLLKELGGKPGMVGQIFVKAQNKIQDPAKLSRVIDMIDKEKWVVMGTDVKGDIYEGLLEKNAEDTKSGAGQYFTPRPLIKAIVECIRPEPKMTIADPSCGTGGFFLAAYDFLVHNHCDMDKEEKTFLKLHTFRGNEIVAGTRRLCLMNLFLHNIGEMTQDEVIISPNDALVAPSSLTYDCVLANPPFGKKSSMTITNAEGEQEKDDLTYNRQDFWVTTSNKQLNFVQHIKTLLKTTGKAAVVVPDNVLFDSVAGETVRRKLLETADLHTILRLPTGIFYANGVKANVLFFDNKPAAKEPWTKAVWFYDYRTNVRHTLKKDPLRFEHLEEFIKCFHSNNRAKRKETWSEKAPEGRWRKFSYKELVARDRCNLDIFWLRDDTLTDHESLPEPAEIAQEIIATLRAATAKFEAVMRKMAESNTI
ncbi:MAG TPA: class I SAM-dependent DNA methyltransferase [Oligoflexus sp.]|uniref:type I restriction-modification system subunit M n=1 Tax=Oligoflexus sp. TaxID=1971216 RepID=UPI002D26B368|nr:class I SAM-dependent DNA methyltransferase [Oligoflexus sp.]HYX32758.1 class I SAM-dependent DNA methyltransferase [Oligoflexus sp.]